MLVTRGHGHDVVNQKKVNSINVLETAEYLAVHCYGLLERDIGQLHNVTLQTIGYF
jgi:hypothetical protein